MRGDMSHAIHKQKQTKINHSDGENCSFGFLPIKADQQGDGQKGINGDGDNEHAIPVDGDKMEHERDRQVSAQHREAILQSEINQGKVFPQSQE